MSAEVTGISVPAQQYMLTRLTTSSLQVRDNRFLADTGDPVLYTITNRTRPSRQDPWFMKRVQDAATRHRKRMIAP